MIYNIDNQLFSSIIYYSFLFNKSNINLLSFKKHEKGGYSNRFEIAGANGRMLISIPVQGGRNNQLPAKEVKINYAEPWQKQVWKTLQSAYSNSPFYEYYAPELLPFFEKKYCFLWDLNYNFLQWINIKLKWQLLVEVIDNPNNLSEKTANYYTNYFTPKNKFSWQLLPYNQVFISKNGFIPNLSILDLLFCEGPACNSYLKAMQELNFPLTTNQIINNTY